MNTMSNTKTPIPMITDDMIEHQKMLEGYREGGPRWTAHTVRDAYECLLEAKAKEEKAIDITARDYFAAKAMAALLQAQADRTIPLELTSGWAYQAADAMLKAREQ